MTANCQDGWVGVLLAAGRGRRFGSSKQLAKWPATGTPLVCAAYDAIASVCARMVVVLGHDAEAVQAVLRPRVFDSVFSDADAPMFESVRSGLLAAVRAGDAVCVVLQPADHPGVGPETLRGLITDAERRADCAVMPEYHGRGGHPVLIPAAIVPRIVAYGGEGGLREYWRTNHRQAHRVPVDDPGVVQDVDEPGDIP